MGNLLEIFFFFFYFGGVSGSAALGAATLPVAREKLAKLCYLEEVKVVTRFP